LTRVGSDFSDNIRRSWCILVTPSGSKGKTFVLTREPARSRSCLITQYSILPRKFLPETPPIISLLVLLSYVSLVNCTGPPAGDLYGLDSRTFNPSCPAPQISRGVDTYILLDSDEVSPIRILSNPLINSYPSNVYFVGVPAENLRISIDPLAIHRSRTLSGSCGGATIPDRDIQKYLGLYDKGLLKLNELIHDKFDLDSINEAIEITRSGKVGRCIIDMTC